MRYLLTVSATALMVAAFAGTASAIDLTQTVSVAAPPDQVWALIADFDSISKWHPAAKTSPADNGNKIGSVRVITLNAPGDPTITEKLTAYRPKHFSYSYAITAVDPKVLPVTGYTSTIRVQPANGGSKVVWKGKFSAAEGADDAAATKAVTGVYRGGLDNIKVLAEK